jgi:hypothetical protein
VRGFLVIALAAACNGCQQPPAQEQTLPDAYQAILDGIAKKCGLPPSTFKRIGADKLQFQPRPDAQYERVGCALTELKRANLPLKLGFVGNESYIGNEQ